MRTSRLIQKESLVVLKHKTRHQKEIFQKTFLVLNRTHEALNKMLGCPKDSGKISVSTEYAVNVSSLAVSSAIGASKVIAINKRTEDLYNIMFPSHLVSGVQSNKPKMSIILKNDEKII